MSRPSQLHQVKLKTKEPTENRPAYCIMLFTATCWTNWFAYDHMLVLNSSS